MRREFSANVSHELKTPLMSISGYAELMMNGMVEQDKVPEFSGRIYHEASRLSSLVSDIIQLSGWTKKIVICLLRPWIFMSWRRISSCI